MKHKKILFISLGILLLGAGITAVIFLTEPEAQRSGATKETAMLVEVIAAEKGTYRPVIVATGTVQPALEVMLSPRVSGEVTFLADAFEPGGFVEKGKVLLQIDPADYRNALALRKSDLQQAQSDLDIEQGRQQVAEKGYALTEEPLPDMNKDLVLRQPQLNAAKARVTAARAALQQARLNLERTTVKAPFDAHILSRNVNVGSQVSPANTLGRLVGMETYWVVLNVPLPQLPWLQFPEEEGERGSIVQIRDRKAWQEGVYRNGYLIRLIGALEEQTRLARVLVAVPDPLAYRTDSSQVPPLMINTFVEARIQA